MTTDEWLKENNVDDDFAFVLAHMMHCLVKKVGKDKADYFCCALLRNVAEFPPPCTP